MTNLSMNTIKFEKGFYVSSMHMCYTHFMDRLIANMNYRTPKCYATLEEAKQATYDTIDSTDEIHYHDGYDNWYHCISRGHDRYDNKLIIKRLAEGNICLAQGYYVVSNSNNASSNNPFEKKIDEYTYRYYEEPHESLEQAILQADIKNAEGNQTSQYIVFRVDDTYTVTEVSVQAAKKKVKSIDDNSPPKH